jgi:hypothetical protein
MITLVLILAGLWLAYALIDALGPVGIALVSGAIIWWLV